MFRNTILFIVIIMSACAPKNSGSLSNSSRAEVDADRTWPSNSLEDRSVPFDSSIKVGVLSNGLTYFIKTNQKPENRAELRLAVKAGSMQEDPDQLGLAHFVEHMAFNGTRNFSKNGLVHYLESTGSRFGPDLNAYTSFDETVYMLQVRTDDPEHLSKGLLILRDWADGVSFDDDEIDKERGVVISEWRTGLSAEQRMQREYLPFLYYRSKYAERLPIGDPEVVRTASYDVVKRFYKDWYRPDLMAVFAVGAFDPDSMEFMIRNQFGSILPSTPIRVKEAVTFPRHEETFVRILTDPEVSNSRVRLIYKHDYAPVENVADYRDRLLHTLYNRILGKRLAEIGRSADPPYIFAFSGFNQDIGDLGVYSSIAVAEPQKIHTALKTLLEENRRILLYGFTQTELQREKISLMRVAEQNVLEKEKQESSRLVQRMISHFLERSPIPDADQVLALYQEILPSITAEEISRLAQQWITDQNRLVIITAPEKDLPVLPDSAEVLQLFSEIELADLTPYQDEDVSEPLLQGRFQEKPMVESTYDPELGIHHWQFDNGIRVSAKPTAFKNDEILMNAYSPGGHSLYSDELYPSGRSTSSVIASSGAGKFNATALEKKLAGQRVSVTPFIFERYEGFNGSASVKDLETMMQLVYLYATDFRRDTVALSAFLSRERGMFGNLLANPQNWFSDKVTKIASQNHPRKGFPTLESYDRIHMDDIMAIYQDRFSDLSGMQFFFVGSFHPDTLKLLTSKYLAALPGGNRKETWRDIGERMPAGVIDSVYARGEAPRSSVQLIYHGDDAYHADSSHLLQALVDVARIKLRESLREEESGVYGVAISGNQSKYPVEQYSIRISFNAEPSRTNDLIEAAQNVIRQLKEDVEESDIIKISEIQRQARIKDLQQNQFWMSSMINSWINGIDLGHQVKLEELEKRIASTEKKDLIRAARKYFDDTQIIRVVMHPAQQDPARQ